VAILNLDFFLNFGFWLGGCLKGFWGGYFWGRFGIVLKAGLGYEK